MSSLSAKDRVSLCQFTFSDGRRCRTPRTGKHPHFCFDHAQKEARANAAESLSKDLAYFFSGDYLSACDLSTALGRLIPAVIRGDIKPKVARTVAYMAQTLLQTIHMAKHEYINSFGTDGWRNSIRNSVNTNYDYRFPSTPSEAEGHAPHSSGGLQARPVTQPKHPRSQPAPHPPVVAGLQTGQVQPAQPAPTSNPIQPPSPAAPPPSCHSERREEASVSSSPAGHPERSEGSQAVLATQPAQPAALTPQSACPAQGRGDNVPQPRQSGPSRDTPWWNFGEAGNIPPDSHLL